MKQIEHKMILTETGGRFHLSCSCGWHTEASLQFTINARGLEAAKQRYAKHIELATAFIPIARAAEKWAESQSLVRQEALADFISWYAQQQENSSDD